MLNKRLSWYHSFFSAAGKYKPVFVFYIKTILNKDNKDFLFYSFTENQILTGHNPIVWESPEAIRPQKKSEK